MDPQEERIYAIVLIISVTLGIILAYFIISIVRQQRRNLELQKTSILAELIAMEKERARIATDLHDDLGPILSVIKFQVDNVESVSDEEKQQLEQASKHLDDLISRMRQIANNLMPSALHRKGLIAAVSEFTRNTESASGIQMRFNHTANPNLSEENSINIYRAIQEVVHNCVKHSGATAMEINIEEKNGLLAILCKDNGKGFDYARMAEQSEGLGLKSLKNRTEIMGGTMIVESKPGKGTAFLFEIPINKI